MHVRRGDTSPRLATVADADWQIASAFARENGLMAGELLVRAQRVLVVVEGSHDRRLLEGVFGPELRAAGIVVTTLYGTHEAMALGDLDFLDSYVDLPITLLTDNTRVDRLSGPRRADATEEEKKVRQLRTAARKRGRPIDFAPLQRPDIMCYIPDEIVCDRAPDFPGWSAVLRAWKSARKAGPFKRWRAPQDVFTTSRTKP